jgi:hypothetical protein
MTLDYLDFDFSEDADGVGSFDAMACVLPAQLPALQAEVVRVLAWAHDRFAGSHGPLDEGGDWDYELQGVRELATTLELGYDAHNPGLRLEPGATGEPRTTISLTLTGRPGFCAAFREEFGVGQVTGC